VLRSKAGGLEIRGQDTGIYSPKILLLAIRAKTFLGIFPSRDLLVSSPPSRLDLPPSPDPPNCKV